MILQTHPVGMIQANCYIVGDEQTRAAVVIDPGGDLDHHHGRRDGDHDQRALLAHALLVLSEDVVVLPVIDRL